MGELALNEHGRLEAVLLYVPGREVEGVDPAAALHEAPIDHAALARELRGLAAAYRGLGVKVRMIPRDRKAPPNLMYVRDLFLRTPRGAVLGRMTEPVRSSEPRYAEQALRRLGFPVLKSISGRGRFEGADALWLDARTVLCGVGKRTNAEGFQQLRAALGGQGVEALSVPAPREALHLLGAVQLVDAGLALARTKIAGAQVAALLRRRGVKVVAVPESAEVRERHGFNFVTVAPRAIVLPEGCPDLERLYRAAGLRVAARVGASQIARGAGGLACATGVLARSA